MSCPISSNRSAVALVSLVAVLALPVWALPEDADQPIHVRADSAELDEVNGLAIYRGAVQMDQGTLRVTAEVMTIHLEEQKVVKITAEGELAHYEQQLKADEGVVYADAQTIVYHTQRERVELIGQAYLNQNDNEFRGPIIEYDMRAGKVDAKANEGHVEMILTPAATQP